MRLGASINFFDGGELLEPCINAIRNVVDFICVVYQNEGWNRNKIKPEDYEILQKLKLKGVIDNITCYNGMGHPKYQEKEKRNLGKSICHQNGCNYFLDMDVDELYLSEQIIYAKKLIEDFKIDYSVVNYINYIKRPEYKLNNIHKMSCIFICKINSLSIGSVMRDYNFFGYTIDSTRKYKTNDGSFYAFKDEEVLMHHMSWVRKDIKTKLENSSAISYLNKFKDILLNNIDKINDDNLKFDSYGLFNSGILNITKVENYFNINLGG